MWTKKKDATDFSFSVTKGRGNHNKESRGCGCGHREGRDDISQTHDDVNPWKSNV